MTTLPAGKKKSLCSHEPHFGNAFLLADVLCFLARSQRPSYRASLLTYADKLYPSLALTQTMGGNRCSATELPPRHPPPSISDMLKKQARGSPKVTNLNSCERIKKQCWHTFELLRPHMQLGCRAYHSPHSALTRLWANQPSPEPVHTPNSGQQSKPASQNSSPLSSFTADLPTLQMS